MGRIKSKLIKRTGHGLLKEDDKFSDKFNDNKNKLKGAIESKKLRNQIAGYITRLKRRKVKIK